MTEPTNPAAGRNQTKREYRVRLPGFVIDEEVGLGDVLKKGTYALGMKPCSGCERRAAALNNLLSFAPNRRQY